MNELENRGNLPPEVLKPREGYREIKIGFWGGQPEILDSRVTGYEMNDIERDIVCGIRDELKARIEKRKKDNFLDGYLIKEHRPAELAENKPPEKHINFSKLFDFAIYAVGIAEILAVLRWIV